MVKVGDIVRFLNSTGGGVVIRFINKELVSVEDEDGFETPVLIRECVVIKPAAKKQVVTAIKQQSVPVEQAPVVKRRIIETKDGDRVGVYLLFLLNDERNMQTTSYDCYLVNDSNYFLNLNYMNKTNTGWSVRYSAKVEPNSREFIEELDKSALNELQNICVQFIAYKEDKCFELKSPVSVELKPDLVRFYKLHSFSENDFFEDDAMVFTIVKNDLADQPLRLSSEDLENAMKSKSSVEERIERNNGKPILKPQTNSAIIEVDLHINQLLDTTVGMSSGDILEYQLDRFKSVLAEYKNKKGQKIVFIHGKGDGVLRKAILNELKTTYKSYYFQDASFKEYGFGATMITIK